MYTANSEAITENSKAENTASLQWKFNIDNGNTGELTVTDALLDTVAAATQRAKSEFLKNAYKLKEINFTTHRTDISKNMIINVKGLPYLVKSMSTVITATAIKTKVRGVRYE